MFKQFLNECTNLFYGDDVREYLKTRLADRRDLSADTATFALTADDDVFRGCTPGGHVDLRLRGGLVRSYSLVDWSADGSTVTIAVKHESGGRGGSTAVHALTLGDVVEVGQPRDDFPVVTGDSPVLLLAGGIGVTPLYAMARSLVGSGRPVVLHYLVRSRALAAFDALLLDLGPAVDYRLHADDEHGPADLAGMLTSIQGAEIYACGPVPMLDALERTIIDRGLPPIRTERFTPVERAGPRGDATTFTVVLDSTGQELEVPADRSALDVLRSAGREVDWSCGEGSCGTCIVDVLGVEGELDHHDVVLTAEEKAAADCLALCVSRAQGRVVLDL